MTVLEGAVVYSNLLVLLCIGLTITYITTGVPNFAQGSMAIFGSYLSLTLWLALGLHPYYSLLLSFIFGGAIGVGIYSLVLRPLIRKEAMVVTLMIATLAVDLILIGILGAYSETLNSLTRKSTTKFIFTPMDFELFGTDAVLVVSSFIIFLFLLSLFLLFYKTKFGIALRASMENPDLAEIMGVNVEHTRLFSWFLSGSLAAVAGSMLPFRQEIVPLTGTIIIVSVFAASVVGGLRSIYGALAGGYIIGMSESLVTFYLSKAFGPGVLVYGRVVSLVLLVIVLIVAPMGIAGLSMWRNKKWRWSTSS
jgi:branched-chain amino acid transport system permease protein